MSAVIEVKVPDIGDFTDVEIIEVLVGEGDSIEVDQTLISLESDKATLEVPSTITGVIKETRVSIGDRVSEGSVILLAEESGDTATAQKPSTPESPAPDSPKPDSPEPEPAKPEEPTPPANASPNASPERPTPVATKEPSSTHKPTTIDNEAFKNAYASPSVRKFARELGVDLSQVKGSGHKERITKDDVRKLVKEVMQSGGVAHYAICGYRYGYRAYSCG